MTYQQHSDVDLEAEEEHHFADFWLNLAEDFLIINKAWHFPPMPEPCHPSALYVPLFCCVGRASTAGPPRREALRLPLPLLPLLLLLLPLPLLCGILACCGECRCQYKLIN
jgi:hypothetical protein